MQTLGLYNTYTKDPYSEIASHLRESPSSRQQGMKSEGATARGNAAINKLAGAKRGTASGFPRSRVYGV